MIVIDTNVVSELMRPAPTSAVLAWLEGQADGNIYTTAITIAEIRYGIARLPAGRRSDELLRVADEVFGAFPEQILPFDAAAAHEYADLVARRERAGNPIDGFDGQIAAICRTHDAVLATRNTRDFDQTGIALTDPWQGGQRAGA
jgi:predicted nucleic acid-binding protein